MSGRNESIAAHYDAVADNYHQQYERERLYDSSIAYPANYFRLQLLLNSFVNKNLKRVIEVGVGEGTPLATLAKAGIEVWGFDISGEMVKKSKRMMKKSNNDPAQIFRGDIQDPTTYIHALGKGQFDGLMAMGVMPHVENDNMVLENMATLVRPGGSVFIEFRNSLFSLLTFNRYTYDFIMNDLLGDVAGEMKDLVAEDLKTRLRMDTPPSRRKVDDSDAPGYDAIPSKFHNPFEVIELFKRHDFENIKFLWYHYHPAMPYLSESVPDLFRKESIRLEHEPSNWRGFFLCSAFVVEATKAGG